MFGNKFVSVKEVLFVPTLISAPKFAQVAPWHLSIRKPVSFDELSCHWRWRELSEIAVTVKLLGALGAEVAEEIGFDPVAEELSFDLPLTPIAAN